MFIVTLWIIHWSTLALLLDNRKVYRHSNTKRELRTHCRYLKAVRRYWEGRYFVILYAGISCRMTICRMTVCKNDRLSNDRLSNDRLTNDRLLNDRLSNDRLLNNCLSNDCLGNDRLTKWLSGEWRLMNDHRMS